MVHYDTGPPMNLILKFLLVFGATAIESFSDLDQRNYGDCDPLQYLSFGKTDIIECSFSDFYGVYWYNSTDITEDPLVIFENSIKSGDGYLSGQYDVHPNGSLIIKNVSLKDDYPFRAICLEEKGGKGITFDIRVYVVVKSSQPHPYINICGNTSICFTQLHNQLDVHCVLSGVRPPANLTWVARNESGDWSIPFQSYVSLHGPLYTTEIQTIINAQDGDYVMHLVCKALSPPDVVYVHEASVLIEFSRSHYAFNETVMSNVEIGKKLTLTCGNNGAGFLTWKKQTSSSEWKTVANIYFAECTYWEIYEDGYHLDESGSLVVYEVDIGNEGIFICVHDDGTKETLKSFEVIVFVSPEPPFVNIQGCESYDKCSLNVSNEGILTCSLGGIRPPATLQWLPYPEESSKLITFVDCKDVLVKTGDTYNISLTSMFTRQDGANATLTVECRVLGWDYKLIDMNRQVELQFTDGPKQEEDKDIFIGLGIGISVGVLIGLLGFIPLASKNFRKKLRGWNLLENEESDTNIETNDDEHNQSNRTLTGVAREIGQGRDIPMNVI